MNIILSLLSYVFQCAVWVGVFVRWLKWLYISPPRGCGECRIGVRGSPAWQRERLL
ncbi:hypothetical protein BJX66DRAFT_312358 [Aspergillus keveii]|uniref:Uncharacterized protein n=1 Tax=Aspergillus keveii TaxID=714993 RepID=A0ABR4FTY2_9EURO